jgi:integrase
MKHDIIPYKEARLYHAGGDIAKEWYIEYKYLIPGQVLKFHRFRERFDINRIHDVAERYNYGFQAVEFMNQKLKQGFNPWLAISAKKTSTNLHICSQLLSIVDELCEGETKNAARDITSHCNRLITFLEEKHLKEMSIDYFTVDHAEDYKHWLLKEKSYSKKTVNSSITYAIRFFKVAIKRKWCTNNFLMSIDKVKSRQFRQDVAQKEAFEPITSSEMDKIFKTLYEKKEHDYIGYLACIYYAWARPSEIRRLRISDIDLENDIIKFGRNDTKSFAGAYVQIVPPLKKLLLRMDLKKCPLNYFLFGNENCKPGAIKLARDYCATKWKQIVKADLEIDKDMYALKHTGNIEYLLRNKGNTDLKWQQTQNRHSSSTMTDRYNRKLGAYFIQVGDLNFRHFE